MYSAQIDSSKCQNCEVCFVKKVCKVRAIIRIDHDEPPFIVLDRCNGCGLCVVECPNDAITLTSPLGNTNK